MVIWGTPGGMTKGKEAIRMAGTLSPWPQISQGAKEHPVPTLQYLLRARGITAHVAAKVRYSAIDGRTTRHPGYAVSQRKRKLVEQVFGWMKTVGGLRQVRHRGGRLVDWQVTFAAAAYNLVRLRTLIERPA